LFAASGAIADAHISPLAHRAHLASETLESLPVCFTIAADKTIYIYIYIYIYISHACKNNAKTNGNGQIGTTKN
jgi:hypothetical protein